MSTIKATTLSTQSNATVSIDTVVNGTAKAWVNFNGTGTVAIRASFNVSSITDNGTGDYTVNFTAAMPDANYAMTSAGIYLTTDSNYKLTFAPVTNPATTSSVRVVSTSASGNALLDCVINCVSIFR